jgi:hypothetical protein
MRRSAVGLVTACALLALGGAATAAPHPAITKVRAAATLQKVGTTESVHRSLDYVSVQHSLTLSYPGAAYVKVHFSRLSLLPGDWLTIADAGGGQTRTYRFGLTGEWAMSVDGDTAVLTLHGNLAKLTGYGVTIDKVAHGFTAGERARLRHRTESVCGGNDSADAVCYKSADPVAYRNSKAVARLLINGDELCSAWRVGPDNRMFTNHHCFTTSLDARNTEVWFNYECAVCGGFATLRPTKVRGDRVLATDLTLDYTLFTVQDFASVQSYGYLSLDLRDPRAGEQLYIAEHPGGDPTVLAVDSDQDHGGNCQVRDGAVDGYGPGTDVSYLCDTAGGSSGSPVLSRTSNRVVALHHFGGCPNAGVRIDLIYRQVGSLL